MAMPPETGYEVEYFYVCFNDECSYYKDGWAWMWNNFRAKSSYRHYENPETGKTGPLPVWSETAMKDRIF